MHEDRYFALFADKRSKTPRTRYIDHKDIWDK
jgi:hypothetical protein